ncbi:LysR family transcriptional regulator [Paraburkholderia sp. MM5477-R1]|uniref:LysR family transcriptional regulator n=1 Tax=Paraburkholderia sp. MM5477-R1 TaxID=2991062 RepID=UPI003D20D8BC
MDLRVLQIFKAVVDEGGVSRAAERLHCVQSNVSTRIRQLEDTLDTRLFERVGNRLTVTPRGVMLHSYAERLLELANEAKQAVRGSGTMHGELRIGVNSPTAAGPLSHALADFHRDHRDVQLRVVAATTDCIVRDVIAQKLDLGIVVGPIRHAELLQTEFSDDELVLLTDMTVLDVRSARDMRNMTVIGLRNDRTYRERMLRWMEEAHLSVSRSLELDTAQAVMSCVSAGLGIAIMPHTLVEKWGFANQVRCHPLPEKLSHTKTVMIWHRGNPHHASQLAVTRRLLSLRGFKSPQADSFITAC